MDKILIELILTNQCNKRCEYCDLDFRNKSLSFNDLDLFISFLKNNTADYTINFFGWEPLLECEKLKYFLDNSKKYVSKFSIWTNWVLLTEEKLEYFKLNNVLIYLSVDNITLGKDLDFDLISKYKDIININFINDPDYINNSLITFEKIKNLWFTNIAFMPVFSTKKRTKQNLSKFKDIYSYVKSNSEEINLKTYTYFNWISIDKQFILDTDLILYSDLDSLLWLQKQYSNLSSKLYNDINNKTKIWKIDNLTLDKIQKSYNIKEIIKLVYEIPKENNDLLEYKLIDKILK